MRQIGTPRFHDHAPWLRPGTTPAFLIALALVSTFAGGCGNGAAPAEPAATVDAAVARVTSISQQISAEGILFPIRQASLSPKITAPVRKFYVERGDKVHPGELLAELDNRDLAAAVVSARGDYEQAQATYASTTSTALPEQIQTATLTVKNTQANLDDQQKLYASESRLYQQGAIARKQLNATSVALTAARSAYESAQKHLENLQTIGESAQREAAKGQLEAAHGRFLAASAQLDYSKIRSPIQGSVAERAVFPGDVAPAGKPLMIVMDTTRVIARLHIPQSQAAQLKLGDPATLKSANLPQTVPGKVTVISPALDPGSTTVEVWVEAANPGGSLQPGGSVDVTITARTLPNALVIPSSAVLTEPNGSHVMVIDSQGRAQSRAVETGIEQGTVVEIVHGLAPGNEVITSGAYGLPSGTKVKADLAGRRSGN